MEGHNRPLRTGGVFVEKNTAEMIVKIWAILGWIGAAFLIIAGIALFGLGSLGGFGMMGGLGDLEGVIGGGLLAGIGIIVGVIMLVFAALNIWISYALWQHKNWARIVTVIFSVLSILSIFSLNFVGVIMGALGLWLFGFEPTVVGLFGAKAFNAKK